AAPFPDGDRGARGCRRSALSTRLHAARALFHRHSHGAALMRRVLVLALLLLLPLPASAKDIVADLIVHRIEITSGFSGAELTLFGAIEGKGDVIAVVHGPSAPGGGLLGGTVDVRRKVRSFGIWVSGP